MAERYRLGWFSTGRGPGSRDLLTAVRDSIAAGEIEADIAFVFCNRVPGQAAGSDQFIELVNSYRIPLVCVSSKRFKQGGDDSWREDFEREVMQRLEAFDVELVVLAGYMLVVGAAMCRRYPMLNLHPALPGGPKGTWKEVIWQLMEERAAETGAMMHRATPVLDEGPAVTYCRFPIRGEAFDVHWRTIEGRPVADIQAAEGEENALFRQIRRHGVARELPLIISTIKAFSQGRVRIEGDAVVDGEGNAIDAYDLSAEIDEQVRDRL